MRIFHTLDRYIIRKFLVTFFLAMVLFSFISVVIDLTEKVDELIEKSVPLREIIFSYYLNFLPYIDTLLSPLFIFISVIFFTSRMAYKSEIIVILASGISFYRMLVPYFITAAFLAGLLLYANHFLVPNTNKKRLAFEYAYIDNPSRYANRNIYLQIEKDKYIYMENFHMKEGTGYKFSYEVIRAGKLEYKLWGERIEWQKDTGKWRIRNYYTRTYHDSGEKLTRGAVLDTALNFKPEDVNPRLSVKEEMNTPVLRQHIAMLKLFGVEKIEYYLIELYRRTADAFTVFILMLIGVSVASRKVRGGSGLHLAIGVALSASFIIFTRFTTTFSTNGNLSPFLSVWIPNVVYGVLAVWMLVKAPK